MKIDFNPNYTNNSIMFGALKNVTGRDRLVEFAGKSGDAACDLIVNNLKANESFDRLCQNFDVNVAITPFIKQRPNSILLEEFLALEVFASKLEQKGFLGKLFGLFKKKQVPISVAKYIASGTEAKTYNLADYITNNFINNKNGIELEIEEFLKNSPTK